tara:strand:- start:2337 stop:2582 length:246 start_codon:yes stop_codon:yes gene_type:complete
MGLSGAVRTGLEIPGYYRYLTCGDSCLTPIVCRHKTHAGIPPPGFSAVKAHAREAAPKAALTALKPGGPLAGKGFMGWSWR